jgi:DNA-binding NtrC family response regulator
MAFEKKNSVGGVAVAVVDDDPVVCDTISLYLTTAVGCQVHAYTAAQLCLDGLLDANPPDIVITDLRMPGMDGLTLLREVKQRSPSTDVILITGQVDKDIAVQALKLGAFDFFEKPIDCDELVETIRRTVRYRTVLQERDRFAEQLSFVSNREAQQWGIDAFVGQSAAIANLLGDIRLLQRSANTSVLVTGESGTGKELVARAIHFGGSRAARPFIPVNCSAIPAELAESMLFGHVRGSFTGATADRKGCFELAHEGTLFLDEICDMPLTMQAKLLRVLEDGIVVPVGQTNGRHVNVRVLAATNADLENRIATERFRADLFHRLATFSLHLPPLRERAADVALLAAHFARVLSSEMGLPVVPAFSREALAMLTQYRFPGNVRELKNIVERALIRCGGREIGVDNLEFLNFGVHREPANARSASAPIREAASEDLPLNLAAAENLVIRKAMQAACGNVSEAARLLGINRTKLHRKLAALQV